MTEQSAHPPAQASHLPADIAVASRRLILTRWVAGMLVILLTGIGVGLLRLPLPEQALYTTGVIILAYNAALTWLDGRIDSSPPDGHLRRLRRFVILQVTLDWLSMSVFLHLTGGITSPAIPVFVIHMLMVTILLPGESSYVYVGLGTLALGSIAVLEQTGMLPHITVIPALPAELHRDPIYILAQVSFFAITAFATVHLGTLVMVRLRERERQLSALLGTAQAVSSTLSLPEVWNQLARSAARALSCKKASIRVLDETGDRIPMVAAFGLSEAYRNKGDVLLSRSQLDREAISGVPIVVQHAATDPRIQFPREVVEEKIGSILVVPITGRSGTLGVLRVYAEQTERFTQTDVEFVMAIARQGAVAMENAMSHAALQQSERARSLFVRTVTHELRAPVSGAQSLLRVLLRGMTGNVSPQQHDVISRVSARLDLLMELINDLLALAASKTTELQEMPETLPLQPAVRQAAELYTQQATEKKLRLKLDLPTEEICVRATPDGLAQIFSNLVGNAVKYTPAEGRVAVSGWREGNTVLVKVEDSGIGIPADDLHHLWEEFFRASNAKHEQIPGTGLGLSIVKRLVETFDGTVRVESKQNVGTTFTVSLPVVQPDSDD